MTELTDKQIADEFDLMMRPRVLPDFVVFARAVIAADRALQNDAWRKAIDDARLSLMLDITAPDANPAECVKELVSWANELALNPAISSDAQALIDRGLAMQAERHREELLAYEVTVGNLQAQVASDDVYISEILTREKNAAIADRQNYEVRVRLEADLEQLKAANLRAQREQAQPVPCPDNPSWHYERLDRLLSMTLSAESYEDYLYSLNIVAAPQAQPERKPMTRAERSAAYSSIPREQQRYEPESFHLGIDAAEAFHDIKETPMKETL